MTIEFGTCFTGRAKVKVLRNPTGRVENLRVQGDFPHITKVLKETLKLWDHHITGKVVHNDSSLIVIRAGERRNL
jgi:hypothetical protein